MSETVLSIQHVKKVIGSKTILNDLSFNLKKGEIFGFLGPNGAGKTTTIRMIAGLSKISAGSIEINGYSLKKDFKKAMRCLGCIVENPELYGYMSGMDNLRLFAKIRGSISRSRIDEVVGIVGLESAIHNKVCTYSLGMKQRLGMAQALLHNPKLLVLDEPTNGLDPAGIREMRELFQHLADKDGMTIFVSSHILAEIQQMCNRVGIINKGRLITVKTVDELINMSGQGGAELLVKTGNNSLAAQLLQKQGIQSEQSQDGLHVHSDRQAAPKVIFTLAGAGIEVYELVNRSQQSLEDVFMELTEGCGGQDLS